MTPSADPVDEVASELSIPDVFLPPIKGAAIKGAMNARILSVVVADCGSSDGRAGTGTGTGAGAPVDPVSDTPFNAGFAGVAGVDVVVVRPQRTSIGWSSSCPKRRVRTDEGKSESTMRDERTAMRVSLFWLLVTRKSYRRNVNVSPRKMAPIPTA